LNQKAKLSPSVNNIYEFFQRSNLKLQQLKQQLNSPESSRTREPSGMSDLLQRIQGKQRELSSLPTET
jgi:hypothetical protein